ncbi:uncharacterized protein LOC116853359 [Odontomachus brunneus]|uniref:uncharacterized protein LOC116853359 n=1 Tax=Odontomachus brunneus TaxID=486640 RepID=UPI0013F19E2D|nr:uncharacterized protein LOC116853359 [Odontomachus brunneus]
MEISADVEKLYNDSCWMNGDYNYNNFFNPNICHVCKKKCGNLMLCDNCYMISYCSYKHKCMHFRQHQQFCAYITQYLRENSGIAWRFHHLETSQWIESRRKFVLAIAQQLPRRLESYEVQMIIFAKSCDICHQQINIFTCRVCYSNNYCFSHILEFQMNHSSKCHELMLCLNLDILYIIPINFKRLITFPTVSTSFAHMNEFLLNNVHCSYKLFASSKRDPTKFAYFCSDYASGPFTLYDGIKKAKLMDLLNRAGSQYVIHVISATSIEYKYMNAWELLHHLLWWIKDVTVVLIGQELRTENINLESCNDCKSRNRRINVVCRSGFYHEYRNDSTFCQPNVIIIFQAQFDTVSAWHEYSLLTSQSMNCPYILTARSQYIADENINYLKNNINIKPVYDGPNNFKSLYPYRQLHGHRVSYRNSHITVYRNLRAFETI